MWRALLTAAAICACQPKQPLQASYFNAEKTQQQGPQCGETLACYAKCEPMTEECMLLCDRAAHPRQAELARAVTFCSAQHGCGDDASCVDTKCGKEKQMCVAPVVAPVPSQMRPQPYPGQAPQPPQQAAAPMPVQPYGAVPPQPYGAAPRAMSPPPVMQPQPYPGQPGYRPPTPPPGYRPPPPPPPPAYRPPPPPYSPR